MGNVIAEIEDVNESSSSPGGWPQVWSSPIHKELVRVRHQGMSYFLQANPSVASKKRETNWELEAMTQGV